MRIRLVPFLLGAAMGLVPSITLAYFLLRPQFEVLGEATEAPPTPLASPASPNRGEPKPSEGGTPTATPRPPLAQTPTPTPTPEPTPTPKSIPIYTPAELDSFFQEYSVLYNVDVWFLRNLAICESGYRVDAKNGPYWGMYQYGEITWRGKRLEMGEDPDPALRLDGKEAIKTTAWTISKYGKGFWPNCPKEP